MKKTQLFLLHFAGGNSYSYQFLYRDLTDFEVIPLELPGRGNRIQESLIRDFNEAALDIYNQIVSRLDSRDFLIYGHSMGAYLALKVTDMLENYGRNPSFLFVSGNAGPGISPSKNRYLLENGEFIQEIKKLGGLPDELISNSELLDFYIPILKADFQIIEQTELNLMPVSAPIVAMMGDEENNIEQIENWGNYTKSKFNYQVMSGGHFFIYRNAQRITSLIKIRYDHATLLKYQYHQG